MRLGVVERVDRRDDRHLEDVHFYRIQSTVYLGVAGERGFEHVGQLRLAVGNV